MAHVLSMTDGTTTITLTSGDYTLLDYTPIALDPSRAMTEFISEDIAVLVSDSTTPLVQSNINAIEKLLTYASNRQKFGTGPKVYLKYQVSGDSDTYRSEIVGGYVDITPEAIKAWVGQKAEIIVHIRRVGYWEDDTATQLVNATGLTNTGAAGANSTLISSGNVDGVLPAPAKIKITNTTGDGIFWDTFHLSCNAWNDPTNFTGYKNGGGASSWTGAQTASAEDIWSFSSTELADMAGDYFRIIACFLTVPSTDIYITSKIEFGVTDLATAGTVYTGTVSKGMYDLGALPFPPGGYYTSNAALDLQLYVRASVTGSYEIDFIQLLPAGPGRYRRLEQIGYDVDTNDSIVDDPYEGLIYLEDASDSNNRIPIVTSRGDPLMLWPGKNNRITVLFDESGSPFFSAARTTNLSVWYHPRRLSV